MKYTERILAERFETGPYWRVNDIDKDTGDKLRRFWGAVFEAYANDLLKAAVAETKLRFIPDPRLKSNPNIQLCDGLLVEGDALIVMEYKSSMFSARAKYGGEHKLLRDEIVTKLVRDSAEKRKKGVEQLSDAIKVLFFDPAQEIVEGLDISSIKHVYPLLITLDDLGGSLLISKLLNIYFTRLFTPDGIQGAEVHSVLCTDVENFEVILPYLGVRPLHGFLQHWLDNDPKLMATLAAHLPSDLVGKRNNFLDREWKGLYEIVASRLFPKEHAAAKNKQQEALEIERIV